MVNVVTGEHFEKRCGSGRSSKCEHCATIHRGDVAAIGRSGWTRTDRPTDKGFWITLTAPGADVLPWDESACTHSAGVPCSGSVGCVVEPMALARWHEDIGHRWNDLVTDLRRSLGSDVQYFKTWEEQARGALHAHAMARATGVTERRFQAAVRLYSRRHGFGAQFKCEAVDLSDSRAAARVAGYCAKYASKNADRLPDVRRLDVATGELRTGGIRSWSASRRWGDTMRCISVRRQAWVGLGAPCDEGAGAPGGAAALDLNRESYATGGVAGVAGGEG